MSDTRMPLTTLHIREFDAQTDSIEALTRMLHKSYRKLAEMGFRFLASHQDTQMTLKRMENARCLVGLQNGEIIATILYYPPAFAKGAPWYDQPHVAKFGQFAVDPEYRRLGIGDELIRRVEEMAIQDGAEELALDTAEGAHHLIYYYTARGYRLVAYTQWNLTNYPSVLMSKKLT